MRQAKVSDANSASTDRLSLANLLELLEEGMGSAAPVKSGGGGGGGGGGAASAAAGGREITFV